jgi:hypothetical protein
MKSDAKISPIRACLALTLAISTCSASQAAIVKFNMKDVALFSSTPPATITATTGQQIPGGFDNSASGNQFNISSLQFDIDGDFDPSAADPTIFFDFQIRTSTFVGGQLVFDGFDHVFTPSVNGSYVVTKGANSYLNLPFSLNDIVGDGVDEFVRDGHSPPGPPANQTFDVAIDEGGITRQFVEGVDNFVGFKLASGDYGWIRVQYNSAGAGTLTFLNGAYDNTGAAILAGNDGTAAPLAGDYNSDGIVNADDYNVWKQSFGSTANLAADGNHNNIVDAADYTIWRDHRTAGSGAAGSIAGVPEPATICLLPWLAALLRRRNPR